MLKRSKLARKTPLRAKTALTTKTPLKNKNRGILEPQKAKRKSRTPLQKLKDKLWAECKRIIRARYQRYDGMWNCYTCGHLIELPAQCQTGHFIPSSICSTELRYDLDNLRPQCYRCNINLSGNWVAYEKHLKEEMGENFPEILKRRNDSTKNFMYRADWYEMYLNNYRSIEK